MKIRYKILLSRFDRISTVILIKAERVQVTDVLEQILNLKTIYEKNIVTNMF